jgi:hypothetical protein
MKNFYHKTSKGNDNLSTGKIFAFHITNKEEFRITKGLQFNKEETSN